MVAHTPCATLRTRAAVGNIYIYIGEFHIDNWQIVEQSSFEFGRFGDCVYISQTTRGDGNSF